MIRVLQYVPEKIIWYELKKHNRKYKFYINLEQLSGRILNIHPSSLVIKLDASGMPIMKSGSFNLVLFAHITDNTPMNLKPEILELTKNVPANKDVVIRIPVYPYTNDERGFEKMKVYESEYVYSKYAENNGIGPKIYFPYFEVNSLQDKLDLMNGSKYPNITNVSYNVNVDQGGMIYPFVTPVIVMESFNEGSVDKFLLGFSKNVYMSADELLDKKINVVERMIEIIDKMFEELHLYCTDIKPQNFVLNIEKNTSGDNEINLKMIDFGTDFCFDKIETVLLEPEYINHPNRILFLKNIIVLQLLMVCLQSIEKSSMDFNEKQLILNVFIRELNKNGFMNISFRNEIRDFVVKVPGSKLAQMIVWYAIIFRKDNICEVNKYDIERFYEDKIYYSSLPFMSIIEDSINSLPDKMNVSHLMKEMATNTPTKVVYEPIVKNCVNHIFNKLMRHISDYEYSVMNDALDFSPFIESEYPSMASMDYLYS